MDLPPDGSGAETGFLRIFQQVGKKQTSVDPIRRGAFPEDRSLRKREYSPALQACNNGRLHSLLHDFHTNTYPDWGSWICMRSDMLPRFFFRKRKLNDRNVVSSSYLL